MKSFLKENLAMFPEWQLPAIKIKWIDSGERYISNHSLILSCFHCAMHTITYNSVFIFIFCLPIKNALL